MVEGKRVTTARQVVHIVGHQRAQPREFCIQGITVDGRPFRPGDWAGAMSCFRPGGVQGGIGAFIGYSPLCVPRTLGGVKCVVASDALKDVEIMAWDFVMNFARDNQLTVVEAPEMVTS